MLSSHFAINKNVQHVQRRSSEAYDVVQTRCNFPLQGLCVEMDLGTQPDSAQFAKL